MKKTWIAGLGFACVAAASSLAAQDATKPPRIAIIDMQRVSSESTLGKSYAAQLDGLQNEIQAEGTKKQTELQKLDAAITALEEDLSKQAAVLSADAQERKQTEITKKRRERQAYLEDGQVDLQRLRERAQQQAQALNNDFQVKIRPHIESVAKEKGYDFIIDSQVAMVINRDFDISRDVIAKADEAEKAKPAAGAAAPGAKPSGPTTPPSSKK
jgi:Skp family chaperone for outer membrane proteins